MTGCQRSWIATVRFWTCCRNWINSPLFASSIGGGGPVEASSGSSRPTSREDHRLALTERFWDFLTMVLLGRMWEVRCVYSKHPRSPTWHANLLMPNHFSDGFSHGICKTEMGQKPRPGFFPGRRALRRSSQWCLERCWSTDKRNGAMARKISPLPLEEGLVTLM